MFVVLVYNRVFSLKYFYYRYEKINYLIYSSINQKKLTLTRISHFLSFWSVSDGIFVTWN